MIANKLLLIRPQAFGFNTETAASNTFQQDVRRPNNLDVQKEVLSEFEAYRERLEENGISTLVINDSTSPIKPDAIFPNNWFATMPDKSLYTFPLEAMNRRIERREDILNKLSKLGYTVNRELEVFEGQGMFLEGTGSMVMDHHNKMIFAAKSSRTSEVVLKQFCNRVGYNYFIFETQSQVYHTNVVMSVSTNFCIVCKESVHPKYHAQLDQHLCNKTVININLKQMTESFLGNCLMVKNNKNENLLIMSQAAYDGLNTDQLELIEDQKIKILASPIQTIESIGGGSARCMIAELF